jgi:hypothetical protein
MNRLTYIEHCLEAKVLWRASKQNYTGSLCIQMQAHFMDAFFLLLDLTLKYISINVTKHKILYHIC